MKVHERLGNPDFDKNKAANELKTQSSDDDSFVLISSLVFAVVIVVALTIALIYYCVMKRKTNLRLNR